MMIFVRICLQFVVLLSAKVSGIFLTGSIPSHIEYPPINFCLQNNVENASISFEFKTSQSKEALLFYAQNKDQDHILISYISSGHIQASVQQRDVVCRIRAGPFRVANGRWKTLTLKKVEGMVSLLFGEVEKSIEIKKCTRNIKASFNTPESNNYKHIHEEFQQSFAYFGGIPLVFKRFSQKLTQPHVAHLRPFNGYLKNVFYRNCSCQATRVVPISGKGYEVIPVEVCDVNRKLCAKGCMCRTLEYSGHHCDCSETYCVEKITTHYYFGFDKSPSFSSKGNLYNTTDVQASLKLNRQLNTTSSDVRKDKVTIKHENFDSVNTNKNIYDKFIINDGVEREALSFYDKINHAVVYGEDLLAECFGNFDLCRKGYTISFWLKIIEDCSLWSQKSENNYFHSKNEFFIMGNPNLFSNQSSVNHGLKISWMPRQKLLSAVLSSLSGKVVNITTNQFGRNKWHHVSLVCTSAIGRLFIDGLLVNQSKVRLPEDDNKAYHNEESNIELLENYNTLNKIIMDDDNYYNSNFYIGTPMNKDLEESNHDCIREFWLDEFNYLSDKKNVEKIKKGGPLTCHSINMDEANSLAQSNLHTFENYFEFVQAKMNKGLLFSYKKFDFISHGNVYKDRYVGKEEYTSPNSNLKNEEFLNHDILERNTGIRKRFENSDKTTCFEDISSCQYGFYLSFWLKIISASPSSLYISPQSVSKQLFSIGNFELSIHNNSVLIAALENNNKHTKLHLSSFVLDKWYFIEFSWNKMEELSELYVNEKIISKTTNWMYVDKKPNEIKSAKMIIFGEKLTKENIDRRHNNNDSHQQGSFIIDELNICDGSKKRLIQTGVLLQEAQEKLFINLDSVGNEGELRVSDPTFSAKVDKDAIVVPGKVNNALRLDNQQCVVLSLNYSLSLSYNQKDKDVNQKNVSKQTLTEIFQNKKKQVISNKWCLFDISECYHGFYMSFWMKIRDNITPKLNIVVSASISIMYFKSETIMTSHYNNVKDPITVFIQQLIESLRIAGNSSASNEDNLKSGIMVFDFKYLTKHAYCVIKNIQSDNWLFVETSWRKDKGLKVLLDRDLECESAIYESRGSQPENKSNESSDNIGSYAKNTFLFGCSINKNADKNDVIVGGNDVAANERKSGKLFLDWVEIFFRDRDYLLAHDHLVRGDIRRAVALFDNHDLSKTNLHELSPSIYTDDDQDEETDYYPKYASEIVELYKDNENSKKYVKLLSAELHGNAYITKEGGRKGNGLTLKGGYALLKVAGNSHRSTGYSWQCLRHIATCRHGITITTLLKLHPSFSPGTLISTEDYRIELTAARRIKVQFVMKKVVRQEESDKEFHDRNINGFNSRKNLNSSIKLKHYYKLWKIESGLSLKFDRWHRLEVTWEEKSGIKVYLNKKIIAEKESFDESGPMPSTHSDDELKIYLGKDVNSKSLKTSSSNITLDQIEFWMANRNLVLAFGLVEDDINGLKLNMERVDKDFMLHRSHVVSIFNNPPLTDGFRGNGLLLNGLNQYMDLGRDVICKSDLDNCAKGITLRLKVKPFALNDLTYFASSPLVDAYYDQGYLIGIVRNKTKQWNLRSSGLLINAWNQIEITWHRESGASMYVGAIPNHGMEETSFTDSNNEPITNEEDYDASSRFYIGRSNGEMRREFYPNCIIDDVEFWEADITTLRKFGHLGHNEEQEEEEEEEEQRNWNKYEGKDKNKVRKFNENYGSRKKKTKKTNYEQTNNGAGTDKDKTNINKEVNRVQTEDNTDLKNIRPSPYNNETFDGSDYVTNDDEDYDWNQRSYEDSGYDMDEWNINKSNKDKKNNDKKHWGRRKPLFSLPFHRKMLKFDGRSYIVYFTENFDHRDLKAIENTITEMKIYGNEEVQTPKGKSYFELEESIKNNGDLVANNIEINMRNNMYQESEQKNKFLDSYAQDFDQNQKLKQQHNQMQQLYRQQMLKIHFKSEQAAGLIFYSGNSTRNCHLSIKSAKLHLVVQHDKDTIEKFKPHSSTERLNDGRWHTLVITSRGTDGIVSLDGKDQAIKLKETMDFFSSGFLYLAGHQNVAKVTKDQVKNNFEGFINKFIFTNSTYRQGIDLIDLVFVKPTRPYFSIHNNVVTNLSPDAAALETTETITFNGREFLKLPKWDTVDENHNENIQFDQILTQKHSYKNFFTVPGTTEADLGATNSFTALNDKVYLFVPFIEFFFKTHQTNSLLLYLGGKAGYTDFLVIEISDGLLYVVLDCGSGQTKRHMFGNVMQIVKVNDGKEHSVKLEVMHDIFRLKIDDSKREFNMNCFVIDSKRDRNRMQRNKKNLSNSNSTNDSSSIWIHPFSNVGTFTYLGGIDNTDKLPWLVWNRENQQSNNFFKGCIRSVRFSGGSYVLRRFTPQPNENPNPKLSYLGQYYDDFGDYEKPLDLIKMARDQGLKEALLGCIIPPELCVNSPCENEGVCLSGMGGEGMKVESGYKGKKSSGKVYTEYIYKICDCSGTQYSGLYCDSKAIKLMFKEKNDNNKNDSLIYAQTVYSDVIQKFSFKNFLYLEFDESHFSHSNDISLRFKTTETEGTLFVTSSSFTDCTIEAFINSSSLYVGYRFGEHLALHRSQVHCDGLKPRLHDNKWHQIRIKRKANHIFFQIDQCRPVHVVIPGEGFYFEMDLISIGAYLENKSEKTRNFYPKFIGYMQNFIFDHFRLFEIFETVDLEENDEDADDNGETDEQTKEINLDSDGNSNVLKTKIREDLGYKILIDGTIKTNNDEKLIPTKTITVKNKLFEVEKKPFELNTISFMFQFSPGNSIEPPQTDAKDESKQYDDDEDEHERDEETNNDGVEVEWTLFSWSGDFVMESTEESFKSKQTSYNDQTFFPHFDKAHTNKNSTFRDNNEYVSNLDNIFDSESSDKVYSNLKLILSYDNSRYKLFAFGQHLLDKHVVVLSENVTINGWHSVMLEIKDMESVKWTYDYDKTHNKKSDADKIMSFYEKLRLPNYFLLGSKRKMSEATDNAFRSFVEDDDELRSNGKYENSFVNFLGKSYKYFRKNSGSNFQDILLCFGSLYLQEQQLDLRDVVMKKSNKKENEKGNLKNLSKKHDYQLPGKESFGEIFEIGCLGNRVIQCSNFKCHNGGRCRDFKQGPTCDCRLTGHAGQKCDQETEAFYFGSSGSMGQVKLTWNQPRDNLEDIIAMMFLTSQSSGTLVRMESTISSDFFEISLFENKMMVSVSLEGKAMKHVFCNGEKLIDRKKTRLKVLRKGGSIRLFINDRKICLEPFEKHSHERSIVKRDLCCDVAGLAAQNVNETVGDDKSFFDEETFVEFDYFKNNITKNKNNIKKRKIQNNVFIKQNQDKAAKNHDYDSTDDLFKELVFTGLTRILLGSSSRNGNMFNPFNGIISGIYINRIEPVKLSLYKKVLHSKPLESHENRDRTMYDVNTLDEFKTNDLLKSNIILDKNRNEHENEKQMKMDNEIFIEARGDVIMTSPPFKLKLISPVHRFEPDENTLDKTHPHTITDIEKEIEEEKINQLEENVDDDELKQQKFNVFEGFGGAGVIWDSTYLPNDSIHSFSMLSIPSQVQSFGTYFQRLQPLLVSDRLGEKAVEYPRAVAVAGILLSILFIISSLIWALYNMKPGRIFCLRKSFADEKRIFLTKNDFKMTAQHRRYGYSVDKKPSNESLATDSLTNKGTQTFMRGLIAPEIPIGANFVNMSSILNEVGKEETLKNNNLLNVSLRSHEEKRGSLKGFSRSHSNTPHLLLTPQTSNPNSSYDFFVPSFFLHSRHLSPSSAIAGMISIKNKVSRPTQSNLVYKGLIDGVHDNDSRFLSNALTSEKVKRSGSLIETKNVLENKKNFDRKKHSVNGNSREIIKKKNERKINALNMPFQNIEKIKEMPPTISNQSQNNEAYSEEATSSKVKDKPTKPTVLSKNALSSSIASLQATSKSANSTEPIYQRPLKEKKSPQEMKDPMKKEEYKNENKCFEVVLQVDSICLSQSGKYLVTCAKFQPLTTWNTKSGKIVCQIETKNCNITDICIVCLESLIVGGVVLYKDDDDNVNEDKRRQHFLDKSNFTRISDANQSRRLQLWDLESGKDLKMLSNKHTYDKLCMMNNDRVITVKYQADKDVLIFNIIDINNKQILWKQEIETKSAKKSKDISVGDYKANSFYVDDVLVSGNETVCVVALKACLQFREDKHDNIDNESKISKENKLKHRVSSFNSAGIYLFVSCKLFSNEKPACRIENLSNPDKCFLHHFYASNILSTKPFKFESPFKRDDSNDQLAGSNCLLYALTIASKPNYELFIWNMLTGIIVKRLSLKLLFKDKTTHNIEDQKNKNAISCVEMCTKSCMILFGTQGGALHALNFPHCDIKNSIQGHLSRVVHLKLSSQDQTLYSASEDGTVKSWLVPRLQVVKSYQIASSINQMYIGNENKILVVLNDNKPMETRTSEKKNEGNLCTLPPCVRIFRIQ